MATKCATKACAAKSTAKPATKAPASSVSRGMARAPQMAREAAMPAPASPSRDAIAQRAREIWQSGKGGSDLQNWLQAEKELRAGK